AWRASSRRASPSTSWVGWAIGISRSRRAARGSRSGWAMRKPRFLWGRRRAMKRQGELPAPERRRQPRPRPTPRWLESSAELDATARSRCLMVLSVLSGEKPVTEAIQEAKISRGTYYQMETRALKAMLAVLNPLASSREDGSADLSAAAAARIGQLEDRVRDLEQDKRRAERLLYLTRKAMRLPPIASPRGRK